MRATEEEKQQWELTAGFCETPGAEGVSVYGVLCRCGGAVCWIWSDVDTDRERVLRLVDRLNRVQPELCHYEDMVLDFIEEEAAKA